MKNESYDKKGGKCYSILEDFMEVSNEVPRDKSIRRLRVNFHLYPHTLAMIRALLLSMEVRIIDGCHRSDVIKQTKKLPRRKILIVTDTVHHKRNYNSNENLNSRKTST